MLPGEKKGEKGKESARGVSTHIILLLEYQWEWEAKHGQSIPDLNILFFVLFVYSFFLFFFLIRRQQSKTKHRINEERHGNLSKYNAKWLHIIFVIY